MLIEMEDFKDLHLKGLCYDLMNLDRNIQLYKAIKDNWSNKSMLNTSDAEWLAYLKDTAVQQSVLYIGRLYDSSSSNKGYITRCIRKLVNDIKCTFDFNVLPKKHQDNFIITHKLAFETINSKDLSTFIDDLRTFLDAEYKKEISDDFVLKRVKSIRNKIVAHNEVVVDEVFMFFEDALKLQKVAEALLDFINKFVSEEAICIFSNHENLMKIQVENIFKRTIQ
jgi:hypothetical protein